MRVLFMGTPDFAVPILNALLTRHEVVAVVTQPDRPKGRGHTLQPPPVKTAAQAAGIPVLQPETLRGQYDALSAYPAEVFVVAAYGLLLSPRILRIPPEGCINVHASLLPRYRGAAPIHYALLNGDAVTGVTIMRMEKGMDTGAILLQKALSIAPGERFTALHDRVADLGRVCILEALALIAEGKAVYTPQDADAATYAPMITKADGQIDWHAPTARILNQLRALDAWPGVYTRYEGQVLKIWACHPAEAGMIPPAEPGTMATAAPGTVLAVDDRVGFMVKTGDHALWVTQVQAGGGKRMNTPDYLRGHAVRAGAVLI